MKYVSIYSAIACLMLSTASMAQYPLSKGGTQINAGIGLSSWGIPIYAGFDYGVHKDISVGGEVGFRSYNENWHSNSYHHNVLGLAANGNYHFNHLLHIPPSNWDVYAGLNLGFFFWSSPDVYPGDHTSGVGLGAQVGGRYYFNNRIGIQLEFGGGNAYTGGKFGVTVKI